MKVWFGVLESVVWGADLEMRAAICRKIPCSPVVMAEHEATRCNAPQSPPSSPSGEGLPDGLRLQLRRVHELVEGDFAVSEVEVIGA